MIASSYGLVVASDRLPIGDLSVRTLPALIPVVTAHHGAWAANGDDESDVADEWMRHVPLPAREAADYRDGQCATVLAPLYRGESQPSGGFQPRWREAYRTVNRRYAHEIAGLAAHGATVWVHDYHLQLVPGHLRRMRPDLRIGFFLHSPFPPPELFLRLPARTEIVSGLLGADLVASQQQRSATNFLEIVGYLTGLPTDDEQIDVGGRKVQVTALPMPADVTEVERLAEQHGVQERAAQIREALRSPKTVFMSVAGWDHADGVELQLRAFQQTLADKRLDPATSALILVAPERPQTAAQQGLRERVERQIAQINGTHSQVGRCLVHYLHGALPQAELVALYQAADIMLATPLQDPITLAAKEFIAARADDTGHLVLSEFAGAATELPQAQLVNPHDTGAFAQALTAAAQQAHDGGSAAMRAMRRQRNGCVRTWATGFLTALGSSPRPPAPLVGRTTAPKPISRRHTHERKALSGKVDRW